MEKKLLSEHLEGYHITHIPMHMPGHKRNAKIGEEYKAINRLPLDIDITEIDGFDDLHNPEGILKESMDMASRFWGSKSSRYLVNGSTCGILASIYALTKPNDVILVARNSHKSVYHAMELRNLNPIYLLPKEDENTGILGSISPEDVLEELIKHPDIKLIVITSPTYEGVISDIETICKYAHERKIPVLVDEAHGAHLGHYDVFFKNSVQCGADVVVQSLHKTLASITQSAVIHISTELVQESAVYRALSIFETSSPSYIMLSSIDACVYFLKEHGEKYLKAWYHHLEECYRRLSDLKHLELFGASKGETCFAYDKSKFVIYTGNARMVEMLDENPRKFEKSNINESKSKGEKSNISESSSEDKGLNMTGTQLASLLRDTYKIELEMSSTDYAIAMSGIGDSEDSLEHLVNALLDIDDKLISCEMEDTVDNPVGVDKLKYCIPMSKMRIGEALLEETELVDLESSKGRISAEYVWAYPPGIPLIAPGELIDDGSLDLFKRYQKQGVRLRKSHSQSYENENGNPSVVNTDANISSIFCVKFL